MTDLRSRQDAIWRAALAACAVAVAVGGAALIALGTCHDGGGFCAESFSSTHISLYAIGVTLVSSAAAVLARTVTRRRPVVAGVGVVTAVLVVMVIVASESASATA